MPTSSDGVVTATVDVTYAAVKLVVDWAQASSPITGTAGNVSTVVVTEATSGNVVRGFTFAPGGIIVGYDAEPLLGVALSYRAVAYDASGVQLASSTAAAVTVPLPAVGWATWLKSLSTPSLSVALRTKTIPDWSAGVSEGVIQVIGRADPVVVQDVRQFETGTIEVWTQSAAAEAALKALLASPGPYLLQQPGFGTADRFVTVGLYSRKRQNNKAAEVNRLWSLPLTCVARPPVAGWSVAIPGRTYADTQSSIPTYGVVSRTNLVPSPQPSPTYGQVNWFGFGGTGGVLAVSTAASGGPTGGPFLRTTVTTAASAGPGGPYVRNSAVSPGTVYTGSGWVRSSVAGNLSALLHWIAADGSVISVVTGTAAALVANTWTRVNVQGTAPAGAVTVDVLFYGAQVTTLNATIDAAQVLLEAAASVGTYFDGDTPDGALLYQWLGTPGNAPSQAFTSNRTGTYESRTTP